MLLANEQSRLMVWLFPLDYEKKHYFTSGQHSNEPAEVSPSMPLEFSADVTRVLLLSYSKRPGQKTQH